MLTVAQVRAAEARDRPYKLADGGGLFLHVAPTGRKTLRLAFRFGGKAQLLVFGAFPEISLADARLAREEARRALRAGVNPAGRRRSAPAPAVMTFATVARAWLEQQRARWSAVHADDVLSAFERHLFPALGELPIGAITTAELLRVLRLVEAGGAIVTARRLRQWVAKIFRRAIAEQLTTSNPAADIGELLELAPDPEHKAAIVDVAGARAAYAQLGRADGEAAVRLAAQLLALTGVRSAALLGARKAEFFFYDDAPPVWRIPASRMKLKRSRKGNPAFDHVVPLAPAAVRIVVDALVASGDSDLLFPRRPGATAPIGVNALSQLHARAGLRGRHCPHGWRASFSTIMNERRPADRLAIDLALAHAAKGKVEAAYNRSEQLGRRRELLEEWAAVLTA